METVGYKGEKHLNLMLNPPVLVVSGVHVAHLGYHMDVGSRRGLTCQQGGPDNPTNPKIHTIILKFCQFFAHNIQAQQPF